MRSHILREIAISGGRMDEAVKAELAKPLAKNRVKERKNPQGGTFSYLEGYDVIDTANELFGFDGWSMEVKDVKFVREVQNARGTALSLYQAIVGVHVGAAYREDVGLGISAGDSQEAQETAVKGAVTDAMKRAFRTFGPQFGNSLYGDDPDLAEEERACPIHDTPMAYVEKNRTWAHRIEGEDGKPAVCTGKAA